MKMIKDIKRKRLLFIQGERHISVYATKNIRSYRFGSLCSAIEYYDEHLELRYFIIATGGIVDPLLDIVTGDKEKILKSIVRRTSFDYGEKEVIQKIEVAGVTYKVEQFCYDVTVPYMLTIIMP